MSSIDASNLFSAKDLVVVITGGGSGIGLMMAKALALNGAKRVYIVGRRQDRLEAAAKESPHGNIVPVQGDVSSKDSLQAVANHITQDVGYINVLIANSGVGGPQLQGITPQTSLRDFQAELWNHASFEDYQHTFALNTSSVFFSVVAMLNLLDAGNQKGNVEQKSQVICTSSIGGFNRQIPAGYAYGQSKAAATHMMKQLATNLAPYGIRSNAIAPGLFPSELAAPLIGTGVFPRDKIPAERVGTEEDMAGCILYMTSKAGAYCNGNVIITDGGRLSVMASTY